MWLTRVVGSHFGLIVLLLIAVAAGILHRVIAVWSSASSMLGLIGQLSAYVAVEKIRMSPPLFDGWNQEKIVGLLRDEFGADYSFLLEYNVPLQKWREIYREAYESRKRFDDSSVEFVQKIGVAYVGEDPDAGLKGADFLERKIKDLKKRGLSTSP